MTITSCIKEAIRDFSSIIVKKEENSVFKSLSKIEGLVNPYFVDPLNQRYSGRLSGGLLYFEDDDKRYVNNLLFDSVKYVGRDHYGFYRWTISQEEYVEVATRCRYWDKFSRKHISPTYTFLKENQNLLKVQYLLNRYELTLITIINVLQMDIEENKHMSKEIESKVREILLKLSEEVNDIEDNLKHEEGALKAASKKSLEDLLDYELEVLNFNKE